MKDTQFISHGRFSGITTQEIEAVHPSPSDKSADIALNAMQAAILAGKLDFQARFLRSQKENGNRIDQAQLSAVENRVAWLRRRSHLLQNGDRPVEVDLRQAALDRCTAIANAQAARTSRAAYIAQAQDSGHFQEMTYTPSRPLEPFICDVVSSDKFQECARPLVGQLLSYDYSYLAHWPFLAPAMRLSEIKMSLSNPSLSTGERLELNREAIELTSGHAKSVCSAATAEIHNLYLTTVKPLEIQLVQVALDVVKERQAQDVETEKAFCSQHAIPYESGKLSKRRDYARAVLERELERFDASKRPASVHIQQSVHQPDNTVLTRVFGIVFDPSALV